MDEYEGDQSYDGDLEDMPSSDIHGSKMQNDHENGETDHDENGDQYMEQQHEHSMRGPFWGPPMRGPGPHGPHGPNGPMGPGPHGRGLWRGPPPMRFRGRGPPGPWPPRGPWRGPPAPPFFRGPRPPFRGPPPFDSNWGGPPGGMVGPHGPRKSGPFPPGPMPGPMPGPGMQPPHGPGPWGPNGPGMPPRQPAPTGGPLVDLDLNKVWVETVTEQGKRYYYNAQSRQTTWTKPEGQDVRILTQSEVDDLTRNQRNGHGTDSESAQHFDGAESNDVYDDSDLPPGVSQANGVEREQNRISAPPGLLPPPGSMGPGSGFQHAAHYGGPPPSHGMSGVGSNGAGLAGPGPGLAGPGPGLAGPGSGLAGPGPGLAGPGPGLAGPAPGLAGPGPGLAGHAPGMAGQPAFSMPPPAANPAPWGVTAAAPPWGQTQPNWGQSVIQAAPAMDNKELDPELVARAADWSEHTAPDGRKYYYNSKTQQSVWIKPQPLLDLEAARLAAQQQVAAAAAAAVAAGAVPDSLGSSGPMTSTSGPSESTPASGEEVDKQKSSESEEQAESAGKQSQSEQQQQPDCQTSPDDGMEMDDDVDEDEETSSAQEAEDEAAKRKREEEEAAAEAKKQQDKSRPVSSTPVPGSPWCVVWTGDKRVFFFNPSTRTSVWERPEELHGRQDVDKMMVPPSDEPETAATQSEQPPTKKAKPDNSKPEVSTAKKIDPGKDAAIEAEERAARERAAVPLDIRMKQFRDMLTEKERLGVDSALEVARAEAYYIHPANERRRNYLTSERRIFSRFNLSLSQVSAFSTWEKELHKIVFDQRYLLLTSRERKQVFEKYVKERAEEERREKRNKMKDARDKFKQLLVEALANTKLSYSDSSSMFSDFSRKYAKDDRFRGVDKSRDRESIFNEYLAEMRRKQKKDSEARREQVKKEFFAMLREDRSIDHRSHWSDVKRRLEAESRYRAVESGGQREDWFRDHLHQLKEARRRDKKRDKKRRRRSRSRSRSDEGRRADAGSGAAGEDSDTNNNNGGAGEDSPNARSDSAQNREDGEHTDQDTDDEMSRSVAEKEKKEREEASLRQREKEVQRTLAEHLRDRDKERELHKHDEAVQNMRALLTDLVRSADSAWRETYKLLRKDQRWSLCEAIDKQEKERLFDEHVEVLSKKKIERFRDFLEEHKVDFGSTWKEMKKTLRDDPRYSKLSFVDKHRNEEEFRAYIRDKMATARAEFRQLLQETKSITHESLQRIADSGQHMKDILEVLRKDSRYLRLDSVPEEREQLIVMHLEELDKRGPPPPPTATDPARRLLK